MFRGPFLLSYVFLLISFEKISVSTSSNVYILCISFILELLDLSLKFPLYPPYLFGPTHFNRFTDVH